MKLKTLLVNLKLATRMVMSVFVTLPVLTLSACNQSPTEKTQAVDDYYELSSGVELNAVANAGPLANDFGKNLVAKLKSRPLLIDEFFLSADGSFNYSATVETKTSDRFVYTITSASGDTDEATVFLTIFPSPVANADEYKLVEGQALNTTSENGVLVNDASARSISAELISSPSNAVEFSFKPDGSFVYKPLQDFIGSDTFTYRIDDGLQLSGTATVRVDVQARSINQDSFDLVSGELLKLSGQAGILKNDVFAPEELEVKLNRLPEHAVDFTLGSDGELIYRTVTSTEKKDSFTYSVISDGKTFGPVEVSINITQPALEQAQPGAFDFCKTYPFSQSVTDALVAESVQDATFRLESHPKLGDLVAFDESTGQFMYQRSSNARGQDSFSYSVLDTSGQVVYSATAELIAVPFRIMPIGDSITSGVELFDGSKDTPASNIRVGYRKYLKDELASAGYDVDFVGTRREGYSAGLSDAEHNGFPGRDDRFVNNNLAEWLVRDETDIILMHIGTNGTKSHITYLRDSADTLDAWEDQNHPVTLLLAQIIRRTDNQIRADAIVKFNQLISGLVDTRKNAGDRIHKVDQFNAVSGSQLSADKLHPTTQGYRSMAKEWSKRLIETAAIRRCRF